jgi:hypothetical protein
MAFAAMYALIAGSMIGTYLAGRALAKLLPSAFSWLERGFGDQLWMYGAPGGHRRTTWLELIVALSLVPWVFFWSWALR